MINRLINCTQNWKFKLILKKIITVSHLRKTRTYKWKIINILLNFYSRHSPHLRHCFELKRWEGKEWKSNLWHIIFSVTYAYIMLIIYKKNKLGLTFCRDDHSSEKRMGNIAVRTSFKVSPLRSSPQMKENGGKYQSGWLAAVGLKSAYLFIVECRSEVHDVTCYTTESCGIERYQNHHSTSSGF